MASLTPKKRTALPGSAFVFPATKSYPIDTMARARAALARVVANGSQAQIAFVYAAVRKRYPTMNVGSTPTKKAAPSSVATPAKKAAVTPTKKSVPTPKKK